MDDIYETDDLWLAAFLRVSRVDLLGHRRDERRHVFFRFAGQVECQQLRAIYLLGDVTLSLADFRMHLNRLLDIVKTNAA